MTITEETPKGGMRRIKMAPSLLNADWAELRREIGYVEGLADVLHLDVMDGNFVPNLTFGPLLVRAIRKMTDLPLDVHLMILRPEKYIPEFAEAGADWISFHIEATEHVQIALDDIKGRGLRAGLALNPATEVQALEPWLPELDFALVMTVVPGFGGQSLIEEALPKVQALKALARSRGRELEVEVDGGVKYGNLPEVIRAGADAIVVGSSIFAASDRRAAAGEIRHILDKREIM